MSFNSPSEPITLIWYIGKQQQQLIFCREYAGNLGEGSEEETKMEQEYLLNLVDKF